MTSSANGSSGSGSYQSISSVPGIECLIGRENGATWKFAVQTYLDLEDLWSALKPALMDGSTFEVVEAGKDWKARAKIILLMEPVYVQETRTAQQVGTKLEKAVENWEVTRGIGILHKLIKKELLSCDFMANYVNQIAPAGRDYIHDFGRVDTLLLARLPDEYPPYDHSPRELTNTDHRRYHQNEVAPRGSKMTNPEACGCTSSSLHT